jgi:dipeptidyl aminopeptidase/acylaminoacyl peptidase
MWATRRLLFQRTGERCSSLRTKNGGYFNVALLDIATRKLTWVTDTQWDARAGDFASEGGRFTYISNEDGRTRTYIGERGSSRSEPPNFPGGLTSPTGNPTAFSPSGDRLPISHQSSNQPGDLWVYDLASRRATQITYSALAGVHPENLPGSHPVHYRSFDGKILADARLLQPHGPSSGLARLRVYRAERARFDRLRHGIPKGQLLGPGRRRPAGRSLRGQVPGRHRLRRRKEDRHPRRILRRLHGHDGHRQDA